MSRHESGQILVMPTFALVLLSMSGLLVAEETDEQILKQAPPPPEEFAVVLSSGYGTMDLMPKTETEFEELLINMKNVGYGTIHIL